MHGPPDAGLALTGRDVGITTPKNSKGATAIEARIREPATDLLSAANAATTGAPLETAVLAKEAGYADTANQRRQS